MHKRKKENIGIIEQWDSNAEPDFLGSCGRTCEQKVLNINLGH